MDRAVPPLLWMASLASSEPLARTDGRRGRKPCARPSEAGRVTGSGPPRTARSASRSLVRLCEVASPVIGVRRFTHHRHRPVAFHGLSRHSGGANRTDHPQAAGQLIWSTRTYLVYGCCWPGPVDLCDTIRARQSMQGRCWRPLPGRPSSWQLTRAIIRREAGPEEQNPSSTQLYRAPWRDRTAYLLLTIYPRDDAVANCGGAGQARGGGLCCRPTYLFITPAKLGGDPLRPTTEGKQAWRRIVPTCLVRS
jgi:hypothetical protein